MPCNLTKNPYMTPKEKAEELIIKFDFNGYLLNESNKSRSIRFAIDCANEIRMESENIYQIMFFRDVIKELEEQLKKEI